MENKSELFKVTIIENFFNIKNKNIIIIGAAGFLVSQHVEALIKIFKK
jgi:hypothetical protein